MKILLNPKNVELGPISGLYVSYNLEYVDIANCEVIYRFWRDNPLLTDLLSRNDTVFVGFDIPAGFNVLRSIDLCNIAITMRMPETNPDQLMAKLFGDIDKDLNLGAWYYLNAYVKLFQLPVKNNTKRAEASGHETQRFIEESSSLADLVRGFGGQITKAMLIQMLLNGDLKREDAEEIVDSAITNGVLVSSHDDRIKLP